MWEYNVRNIKTGEYDIFFGYNWGDAVRRTAKRLNVDEDTIYNDYDVLIETYID